MPRYVLRAPSLAGCKRRLAACNDVVGVVNGAAGEFVRHPTMMEALLRQGRDEGVDTNGVRTPD